MPRESLLPAMAEVSITLAILWYLTLACIMFVRLLRFW